MNAERASERGDRSRHCGTDCAHLISGQLGRTIAHTARGSAMNTLVLLVIRLRAKREIGDMIVRGITISMPDLLRRLEIEERFRDKPMDKPCAMSAKGNSAVRNDARCRR